MGDVIIDGLTGANRLVILDANGKIPALDGSAVTNVAGANFSTGTIPVARLDTGTTAGKIVKLDGTAKLPAVSGAALTGVAGATKNASDPTISTNPSGGVGTEWHNTTSGEVYVCTDATAGANVWKNVGEQSGNIQPFGASNYGYCAGGGYPNSNVIDKWSFASATANATDVGDLYLGAGSGTSYGNAGSSSETDGYASGGYMGSGGGYNSWNTIDKWSFSTDGNATDVGDMTQARRYCGGTSSSTHGYVVGGYQPPGASNIIERFSFSAGGNAVDVGDMTTSRDSISSTQSGTHGYANSGSTTAIEKWSYASATTNAVLYGGVTGGGSTTGMGNFSETYGYFSGISTVLTWGSIEKFSFASEANSTAVGVLTDGRGEGACGVSAANYGYTAGGDNPSINIIDRFSYTTDGNATDVGDLTVARAGGQAPAQY